MSIPATMRALQQTSLNGPRDLRLITGAPVPAPGHGEILIRVAAPASTSATSRRRTARSSAARRPPYLGGFETAARSSRRAKG